MRTHVPCSISSSKVHYRLMCSVEMHGKVLPCRAAATCLLPTLPLGLPLLADMYLTCMMKGMM